MVASLSAALGSAARLGHSRVTAKDQRDTRATLPALADAPTQHNFGLRITGNREPPRKDGGNGQEGRRDISRPQCRTEKQAQCRLVRAPPASVTKSRPPRFVAQKPTEQNPRSAIDPFTIVLQPDMFGPELPQVLSLRNFYAKKLRLSDGCSQLPRYSSRRLFGRSRD